MRVAGVEDGARGVETGGAHPRSVSACTNCWRISPELVGLVLDMGAEPGVEWLCSSIGCSSKVWVITSCGGNWNGLGEWEGESGMCTKVFASMGVGVIGVETGEVFPGPPCLCLCNIPMHHGQSGRYVKKWTSFSSNQLLVWKYCQDLHQAPASSSDDPDQWASGAWYEAHRMRHKLNLCVGSPVTAASGVLDNDSELSQRLSWRQMETLHQATWITQSEYKKEPEYDVLVDFQTGEIPSTWQIYIYTCLWTKCDGAQKWASVFCIPTLVASSGVVHCFIKMLLGSMCLVQGHGK